MLSIIGILTGCLGSLAHLSLCLIHDIRTGTKIIEVSYLHSGTEANMDAQFDWSKLSVVLHITIARHSSTTCVLYTGIDSDE